MAGKSGAIKLESGDTVRFIDSYDGYFRDYKDMDLTVSELIPRDSSGDDDWVRIMEIAREEPHHMIYVSHLVKSG